MTQWTLLSSALGKMDIIRKCSITIMTKDELVDIYQLVENALKIGHGGGNQQTKKATKAEKDSFMTWKLSRQEQTHELYQLKIKESKTAVAMQSTGNDRQTGQTDRKLY